MLHLQLRIPVSREVVTLPTTRRASANAERTPRRKRLGWNVSICCDSQAPGAGRSSSTFWHILARNGLEREGGSYQLGRGRLGGRGKRLERRAFREAAWTKDSQAKRQAWRKLREIFVWVLAEWRSVAVPCKRATRARARGVC